MLGLKNSPNSSAAHTAATVPPPHRGNSRNDGRHSATVSASTPRDEPSLSVSTPHSTGDSTAISSSAPWMYPICALLKRSIASICWKYGVMIE